ncbi:MAG: SEC-C metal-binding domain-containing protein [Actinomycetota bacterium]|nr:SEC-C metal-binding domain-containing protein [Actinomycetota bacterium]
MPEITFEESCRQVQAITDSVRENKKNKDWAAALAGVQELLGHPCAHHQVVAYEAWDDIHEIHKQAGDYDAAIAAKQEAVRVGYQSVPDPDADIAECHLRAGRRAEADALFADVKARTPDDVWLYNAAGFSYAWASDPAEAARWFREGIDVALRTGDADQVVFQLLEGLEGAWTAAGQAPEPGLKDRAEAFAEAWEPPSGGARTRWDDLPPHEDRPCGYCGYDPDRSWAEQEERRRRANRRTLQDEMAEALARLEAMPTPDSQRQPTRLRGAMVLSVAWFPLGEWEKATSMWPDLLDDLPAEHSDYSHRIEARIKRVVRAAAGHPMRVSPMTVDGLLAHSIEHDDDPAKPEARSSYAAEISHRGEAVAWPPGRNAPCWCGSGRKYKTCCGPIPPAPK